MRFPWSNFLILLIAEAISGVTAQNLKTCVTGDVDPNKDYFPDKVEIEFAGFISIEYHNTYKILTNTEDNVKYVLYQCGTEPPTGVSANLTLAVPLQNGVALSTTVHLPFFELLGLRDEVKAYLGDPKWISSPCMQDRLETGDAILVLDPYAEGELDGLYAQTASDLVIIHNPIYGYDLVNQTSIAVSEWLERDSHKIAEYIKLFAALFNEEAKANQAFQGIMERYECTSKNAERVISDGGVVPKVVFAEYSTYCGGWSIGACPNFYCDLVTDCASELLEDPKTGSIKNPDCGLDFAYMTTDEFVAFAKDADVWIYPGHGDYYWDTAYADYGAQLDQMKAVQNKKVYDTVLSGLNVWFEHRIVEYDVVLEDMCLIVGATHPLVPHERIFLRNVFDEPVGDLGNCTDPSIGFTLRADQCRDLEGVLQAADTAQTTAGSSSSGSASGASVSRVLLLAAAFLLSFL